MLKQLTKYYPNGTLSLKADLTFKVLMLLLLVSGQRGQSIHLLDLHYMKMEADLFSFDVLQHIKTSRPVAPHTRVEIPPRSDYLPMFMLKGIYPAHSEIRGTETMLFISYVKPYKAISRDTISRWAQVTLKTRGIDTTMFSAHSTRAASASKACAKEVPIHEIIAKTGWGSAQTFYRHYFKPVIEEASVASVLLSSNA